MDARKSSIKEFLAKPATFFVIPVYQRNFCWGVEQCRKLFDDVVRCLFTKKTHFLGTICYKADENNTNVIIDGQQRITCLSLLLKALYDISSDGILRQRIQNEYLLNPCDNGTMKLKLKPIQRDAGVYKRLLSHYRVDSDVFTSKETQTPLFKAFQNYKLWIRELAEIDDYENKIFQIVENLEIIEIIVTGENPQEIFESLNATGTPLSNTDILRNYLLMTIPYKEQERLYNTYWLPMEETVTTEEIENFVSSYLVMVRRSDEINVNGKRWKINPNSICIAFREHFYDLEDLEELEDLFADMYKYSQYYKHVVFDKSDSESSLSSVDKILHELFFTLNADGFKPLAMYLFDKINNGIINSDEMCEILKTMVSYTFRSCACGNRSFSYQFSGFIMAKLENYKNGDDFVKLFKKAISSGHGSYAFPSDAVFEHALLGPSLRSLSIQRIKYLLYSIEKKINPRQNAALTGGTIEHIMPQTLSDVWNKYLAFNGDTDVYEEKVWSLGNLTLSESNSMLSNKSFDDKKAIYADSIYEITRALNSVSAWTAKNIDARGKRLFDIALTIWPGIANTGSSDENFIKYTLDSDLSKVTSIPPASFSFLGEEVPVSSWAAIGVGVVNILYTLVPDKINQLVISCPSEIEGLLTLEPDFKKQYSKIADKVWLNQPKKPSAVLNKIKSLLKICSNEDHSLCDEFWFTLMQFEDDDDIIIMQ